MSQPAAPCNRNIRVFTQSGPKADIASRLGLSVDDEPPILAAAAITAGLYDYRA
jgi:hypothetical protein